MPKTIHSKKYKEFIIKLRKARLGAGLTQKEAAKKLQRPQSYMSKVEAGEQRVDIIELKAFSGLYNKPINYFMEG